MNALRKPIKIKSLISVENTFFSTRKTKKIPIRKLPIEFTSKVENGNFPSSKNFSTMRYLQTAPKAPPKAITAIFIIKVSRATKSSLKNLRVINIMKVEDTRVDILIYFDIFKIYFKLTRDSVHYAQTLDQI